jgi:maltooligosyltrehalose trehalohydrolase
VRRGPFALVANFSRRPSHVPLEVTAAPVVAAGHITLEPGYVVLPPLSGALLRLG